MRIEPNIFQLVSYFVFFYIFWRLTDKGIKYELRESGILCGIVADGDRDREGRDGAWRVNITANAVARCDCVCLNIIEKRFSMG